MLGVLCTALRGVIKQRYLSQDNIVIDVDGAGWCDSYPEKTDWKPTFDWIKCHEARLKYN